MKTKSIVATMAMMLAMGSSVSIFAQNPVEEDVNLNIEQATVMQKIKGNRLNNFEGLVLTDSQVQAIDSLNQKVQQNRPERNRQKPNNISKEQRMAQRQQAGRDYLEEVQEILTPDQYVTYLENIVLSPVNKNVRQADATSTQNSSLQKAIRGGKNMQKDRGMRKSMIHKASMKTSQK